MRVYYSSNGCSAHKYEVSKLVQVINAEAENDPFKADVVIAYFCGIANPSFTDIPVQVEFLRQVKIINPSVKVFAGGCAGEVVDLKRIYPWLDGAFSRNNMVEDLAKLLTPTQEEAEVIARSAKKATPSLIISEIGHTGLILSKGCRKFCSFCKVHYIKPRYEEIDFSVAIHLIDEAVEKGASYLEICGENNTEYGLQSYGYCRLVELLRAIVQRHPMLKIKVDGVCLDEVNAADVRFFKETSQIISIQLETQHLIDSVRRRMNLTKPADEVLRIIKELQAKIVGSSVIVGHPGETKEDFNRLIDIVRENELYALRFVAIELTPGTPVYNMTDKIPHGEAVRRSSVGGAVVSKLRAKYLQGLIDSGVVFDCRVTHIENSYIQLVDILDRFVFLVDRNKSGNSAKHNLTEHEIKIGDFLRVRPLGIRMFFLRGAVHKMCMEGEIT